MKQKEKQRLARRKIFFGAYCLLMLWLLFDRTGAETGVSYWQQVKENLNLTPLRTIEDYWHVLANPAYYLEKWEPAVYEYNVRHAVINLAGNVIMFLPFGFFLPGIYRKMEKFLRCLLAAAVVLVLVELTQLFTLLGSCDVDDLILNLAGVTIGWCTWKAGRHWRKKK